MTIAVAVALAVHVDVYENLDVNEGVDVDVDIDASESFVRQAPYLGISGVGAIEEVGSTLRAQVNAKNGGGVSVRGGYRMFRYASIEVEGEWIRELGKGLQNPYIITANLRFYYPLGPQDRIQPYAMGGIGVSVPNVNGKNEVTGGWRAGLGGDFYIDEHWSIGSSAEWVSTTNLDPALNYISLQLGVQYLFGVSEDEGGL